MPKYASCSKILEDTRVPEGGYASRPFYKALRVPTSKIRMSKLEVRNNSQARNPNERNAVFSLQDLNFGIVSDFGIRVSDFYAREGVYLVDDF